MHDDIYHHRARRIDGEEVSLGDWRGKLLLIVNVASQCGFTPQYASLEALWQRFHDRGFDILAFPCNQFGHQEPGTNADIAAFATSRYGVSFPLFTKIDVNGPHTHPLYQQLKAQATGLLGSQGIKWNFTKFLVNRAGVAVERFAPTVRPDKLVDKIIRLL